VIRDPIPSARRLNTGAFSTPSRRN
jgi:hypothetical protein